MIFFKWATLALLDWLLLLTIPFAAPVIAAFTSAKPYGNAPYTWGWLWGTYDNPPQGDEGFVRKRAWFPCVTNGWRGYLNRINWMIRNPLYGYARMAAVKYSPEMQLRYSGNPNISDKYRVSGWYFATLRKSGKLVGFEFYAVLPWCKTRDLRVRLGWKIMTDKFQKNGFAPLVNTFNPLDGYGNK